MPFEAYFSSAALAPLAAGAPERRGFQGRPAFTVTPDLIRRPSPRT